MKNNERYFKVIEKGFNNNPAEVELLFEKTDSTYKTN